MKYKYIQMLSNRLDGRWLPFTKKKAHFVNVILYISSLYMQHNLSTPDQSPYSHTQFRKQWRTTIIPVEKVVTNVNQIQEQFIPHFNQVLAKL
jgi:hypothetical protein